MTQDTSGANAAPRGRGPLLLLLALFFGPLLAAAFLYFGTDVRPAGQTHHGTLLEPVQPVPGQATWTAPDNAPPVTLRGELWTLMQFVPADCQETCREHLQRSRQVWLALDRRRVRVQRVALAPDAESAESLMAVAADRDPDLHVRIAAPDSRLAEFFRATADAPGTLYLIDPIGNWVLWYAPETDLRDIHTDIKKLLRISRIG